VRFTPRSQADLAPTGVTTRIRANLAALRVREQLNQQQRPATSEEQQVLARWSSWGAVAQPMFARPEYAWARDELADLLSPEDVAAARGATLNAHFTDAALVQQVWRAVTELGFTEGQVLEPGCGSGNFIGFAPSGAEMTGVELDPATADIASLLYPDASIRAESFAATRPVAGMFDLAVGNVPFGNYVAHDPTYNADRLSIHNAFIYKAVQLTRPGGLVAVFTSRYTMDGTDSPVRERLAALADLVGAVRLPSGAHRKAAGTDVVTDLLILRRREPDRQPDDTAWAESAPMRVGDEQIPVNEYFQQHPELVLGQMTTGRGAHSETDLVVDGPADASLLLGDALDRIVPRAKARGLTWTPAEQADPVRFVEPNPLYPDRFIRAHDDGSFTQLVFGVQQPFAVADNQAAELRALLGLRDTVRDLLLAEAASETSTPEIEELRQSLNQRYDAYLDRYGPINRSTTTSNGQRRRPNLGGFRKDPFASLVRALEEYDPATGTATKAEIFHKRAELPREQATAADNPTDALAICMDRHGQLQLAVIAELLGLDQRSAREALGTLVFDEPFTDRLVLAGEYLSGNVRAKLEVARKAAAADSRFAVNVTALSEVIPADIPSEDIRVQLGAAWIDASYVEQFLRETLNDPRLRVDHPTGSTWNVISYRTNSLEAIEQWGTRDVPAQQLAESLLRRKPVEVRRSTDNGSYVDVEATAIAAAKATELEERFGEWVWEDPARAADLARKYNDEFNSTRLREFGGSYLSLPGLAMNFSPRAHQSAAVERILMTPAVGLFHEVGAGKTSEMIIGAMELRRLGLAKKPVIVTPKNVLDAFAREFLERYPRARLLVGYQDDTDKAERRNFIARAAASDWDAVLMTREAFEAIPLDHATRKAYLQRAVDEVAGVIDLADAKGMDNSTVKDLETQKKRAQERVERMMDKAKDDGIDFKLTGIDYIFADEAHAYKNLMTLSSMPGMSISPGSGRALDLHMKLEHLRNHYSRVATLATATPITRTLAEIYNWMRYLDPQQLHQERGITDFDQFLATFATTTTDFEVTITGGLKLKSRVNKVVNLPELITMFRSVSDIKTAEDLKLPTPLLVEREDGKRMPQVVVVPPGPNMREHKERTERRAEMITGRQGATEYLRIINDGKKAAVDLSLVGYEPDRPSKLTMVADNIARIWQDTKDNEYLTRSGQPSDRKGALQIVFCDLGVPPDAKRKRQGAISVYDSLRDELAARGIPADQVRYVHEAGDNEYRKGLLFDECNDGKVSVLIASTGKAGVGTNIQRRAVALHHVDCTWNPSDMVQREGRIKRQGNQNPEIYIFNYVAEGSFDGYVYQTVERKARTIGPVMSGKLDAREVEDVGEVALSMAEVKALASGNPLLLEVNQAERDLKQLERMQRNHANGQRTIRHTITSKEQDHRIYLAAAAEYAEAVAIRTPTRGDAFAMTVGEQTHRRRPDAEAALHQLIADLRPGSGAKPIGTIGGLTVTATTDPSLDPARRRVTLSFAQATHSEVVLYANGLGEGGKAVNIVQRLENRLGELESQQAHYTSLAETAAAEAERAHGQLGRPFRYTAELEAAREKYTELKAKLAEQNKKKQAEPATTSTSAGVAADTAAGPTPAGGSSQTVEGAPGSYRPPAPATPSGPVPPVHRLADGWRGDLDAALQVAVALTEQRGFTSKKAADQAHAHGVRLRPTASLTQYALTDTTERTEDLREQVQAALTPAVAARAALIRQWAQALPDNGGDYLSNLGRAARLPQLSTRELPTLVSAVSAYARHEQAQAGVAAAGRSAWQGSGRQRLSIDQVTVAAIQANASRTGLDVTASLVDTHGNLYRWQTNQRPPFAIGDRGQIVGTVKGHRLGDGGAKETVLARGEWTPAVADSSQQPTPATMPSPTVKPDPARHEAASDPRGPASAADTAALATAVEQINQRHGTTITVSDLTGPFQDTIAERRVRQAALANDEHNFCLVFNDLFAEKVADHIDSESGLVNQYFSRDHTLRNDINASVNGIAWRKIREQEQHHTPQTASPAATARLSFATTQPTDTPPAATPEAGSPPHSASSAAATASGPAAPATSSNPAALARAAGSIPAGSPAPAPKQTGETDQSPAWASAYPREPRRSTRAAR